jgi:hypothetical protein
LEFLFLSIPPKIAQGYLVPRAKADVEAMIDGTLEEDSLLKEGEAIAEWLAAHPLPESERNPT